MPLGVGMGISSSLLPQSVSAAAPADPILEDISVSFAAATVKLRTAYAGQCVRLRRSSDNAESDFGFTALNVLDTAAIATWLSGSNGFIVTWYDQSGNGNNAGQAAAGSQPQYIESGIGGYPDFSFNGSSHYLDCDGIAPLLTGNDTPYTVFHVLKFASVTAGFYWAAGAPNYIRQGGAAGNQWYAARRGVATATFIYGTQDTSKHLLTYSFAGTTMRGWLDNGSQVGPSAMNTTALTLTFTDIGRAEVGTSYFVGNMTLMIVLGGSELSDADRGTINSNTVSVYGI